MFYVFLVIVAILGVGVYLLFIFRLVPGAAEERLARHRKREERLFFEEGAGLMAQGRLVRQVRYRNLTSNAIEEVEPDEVVKRKRIRPN